MIKIIQNAAKITEGKKVTCLISTHRHDFVEYEFKDGSRFFRDGGADYVREGWSNIVLGKNRLNYKIENISLSEDSNFSDIVNNLLWGTRGKDGKQKLKYKPLITLTRAHLQAILDTQNVSELYIKTIKYILDNNLSKK